MKASVIYRYSWLYEACIFVRYRQHYRDRCRALAELIPANSSVVDVCCGPATLYFDHLRKKNVQYTGLDINAGFVRRLAVRRVKGVLWDMHSAESLPRADYLVMQGSLYHFLPDPKSIVDRMLAAARCQVIISEPVRNLADSKNPILRRVSQKLTDPGTGDQVSRFNEQRFDQFFELYRRAGRIEALYWIAGDREKVCVLNAELGRS